MIIDQVSSNKIEGYVYLPNRRRYYCFCFYAGLSINEIQIKLIYFKDRGRIELESPLATKIAFVIVARESKKENKLKVTNDAIFPFIASFSIISRSSAHIRFSKIKARHRILY